MKETSNAFVPRPDSRLPNPDSLHSKYNPQLEARRYIDALKTDNDINCFILVEPGMGYMVQVLREKRPDGKIIVLHADAGKLIMILTVLFL